MTLLLLVGLWLASTVIAVAQIPRLINLQGRLTDDAGNVVPDGDYQVTFAIYNLGLGGSQLWTSGEQTVTVTGGMFNYILGLYTPIPSHVFVDSPDRWVGITIGSSPESLPRIKLTSGAYAYHALRSDTAEYSLGGLGGGWVNNVSIVSLIETRDSVGIGTSDPEHKLDVLSSGTSIRGRTTGGGDNIGVYGHSDSDGRGVVGASTSGNGVHGISGSGYAGYFEGPKSLFTGNAYFFGSVGIGTDNPAEMMHIENSGIGQEAFLKIHTSHPTNWHEAGIRIETPQNKWHLRMDDDSNNQLPNGALGLRSQVGIEVMTWDENGSVGIGDTSPESRLDVGGDLRVTGAYKGNIASSSGSDGAPFPRPAYDSGWEPINQGDVLTLNHSIGGNADNYVVDLQFWESSYGVNAYFLGGDVYRYTDNNYQRGAFWRNLTNSSIQVVRQEDDFGATKIRVRIWVYQ
jgi:hypothetical protein